MARSKGTPKSVLLATRVTPSIEAKIKQMAHREGLYVSEWIRQIIVSELKNQDMLGPKFHAPENRFSSLKEDNILD